jgi:hypothetical protein
MSFLFVRAVCTLISFDLYIARRNFGAVCCKVREYPVDQTNHVADPVGRVCTAIDLACIWYPKRVQCLQRSAATTCLLRSCGVAAQLVIGAQQLPFRGHAWVEVNGKVVNDKPYTPEIYGVLDRW